MTKADEAPAAQEDRSDQPRERQAKAQQDVGAALEDVLVPQHSHHVSVYGGAVGCVSAAVTEGCLAHFQHDDQRVTDLIHAR